MGSSEGTGWIDAHHLRTTGKTEAETFGGWKAGDHRSHEEAVGSSQRGEANTGPGKEGCCKTENVSRHQSKDGGKPSTGKSGEGGETGGVRTTHATKPPKIPRLRSISWRQHFGLSPPPFRPESVLPFRPLFYFGHCAVNA
jgi:hypothetical protein